mgnify:CR=1 FL=1
MNDIPDIEVEYDDQYNPMVSSPNAPYSLPFYMTRETMIDVEVYKNFLDNHCQIMPNITEENVGSKGIEMNHNFLTIFDIALMITEHVLNTVGYICTFDLIYLLKQEHAANRIPIVMISETVHEMYHQNEEIVFPAQMCFGYWVELLQRYSRGITPRIAQKVINYIDRSINDSDNLNSAAINDLLGLRDSMEGWSRFNEYGDNRRIGIIDVTNYNYQYNNNYPYLEG